MLKDQADFLANMDNKEKFSFKAVEKDVRVDNQFIFKHSTVEMADRLVKLRIKDGEPEWDWGELPSVFRVLMESCDKQDQIKKPMQCLRMILSRLEDSLQKRPEKETEKFWKEKTKRIFKEVNPQDFYKTNKKLY